MRHRPPSQLRPEGLAAMADPERVVLGMALGDPRAPRSP